MIWIKSLYIGLYKTPNKALSCLVLSHKRDQIKMRDYTDRWAIPPKRDTSATWGPPLPCKQALKFRDFAKILYFESL